MTDNSRLCKSHKGSGTPLPGLGLWKTSPDVFGAFDGGRT